MRVADKIFEIVKEHTDTVFFLPGGGSMFLNDALGQSGLRAVSMLHEQGAGYAACGHAAFGGFGVCLVTSGPGATNAVTPCLAAWMDSWPVLFISGQARTSQLSTGQRCRGPQEVDIISIVKPITKNCYQLRDAENVSAIVRQLIDECKEGRPGPVWLDVPADIQAMEVE
jgi:acetolactate synthase-1/2/3 large subunit